MIFCHVIILRQLARKVQPTNPLLQVELNYVFQLFKLDYIHQCVWILSVCFHNSGHEWWWNYEMLHQLCVSRQRDLLWVFLSLSGMTGLSQRWSHHRRIFNNRYSICHRRADDTPSNRLTFRPFVRWKPTFTSHRVTWCLSCSLKWTLYVFRVCGFSLLLEPKGQTDGVGVLSFLSPLFRLHVGPHHTHPWLLYTC